MSSIDEEINAFEKDYEVEEIALQVLVKEACNGARKGEKVLFPSVKFLASIHKANGEFDNQVGRLNWAIEDRPDRENWGYEFEKLGIYDVVVRKHRPCEVDENSYISKENWYMLVACKPATEPNEQLIKIKESKSKVVNIETDFGKLVLNREFSWFEGEIDWNGAKVSLSLETDEEDGELAENALAVVNKLAASVSEWDMNMKKYAMQELLELANQWLEDNDDEDAPENIDEQYFINAIKLSDMVIHPDGSITAYYDDGDLFWGHSIEVDIDEAGEFVSADVAG